MSGTTTLPVEHLGKNRKGQRNETPKANEVPKDQEQENDNDWLAAVDGNPVTPVATTQVRSELAEKFLKRRQELADEATTALKDVEAKIKVIDEQMEALTVQRDKLLGDGMDIATTAEIPWEYAEPKKKRGPRANAEPLRNYVIRALTPEGKEMGETKMSLAQLTEAVTNNGFTPSTNKFAQSFKTQLNHMEENGYIGSEKTGKDKVWYSKITGVDKLPARKTRGPATPTAAPTDGSGS